MSALIDDVSPDDDVIDCGPPGHGFDPRRSRRAGHQGEPVVSEEIERRDPDARASHPGVRDARAGQRGWHIVAYRAFMGRLLVVVVGDGTRLVDEPKRLLTS